jgi:hypothetical protein
MRTFYCQVYSNLFQLIETMSIDASAIVRIPCHKTMICPDFQLTTTTCKTNRIIVTPGFEFNIINLPQFVVPIKNMTQTLMSLHHIQLEKSIKELISTFSLKQSNFQDTLREFALYILSGVCCIFIMIFFYIFKLIKYKVLKPINNLDCQVQDIVNFSFP